MASTPFSGSSLYSAEQTETAVRDDEYRRRREKCGGHTTLINCARCSRPAGVIMDDPAVTGRTERRDWAKIRTPRLSLQPYSQPRTAAPCRSIHATATYPGRRTCGTASAHCGHAFNRIVPARRHADRKSVGSSVQSVLSLSSSDSSSIRHGHHSPCAQPVSPRRPHVATADTYIQGRASPDARRRRLYPPPPQ